MALIFADLLDWSYVYQLMGLLMLIGAAGAVICNEPHNDEIVILRFDTALIESIKISLVVLGLWASALLLLIISTYRLTDIVMGPMAMPFYLDLGFSKTEIGALVKTIALLGSIVGFFIGGFLIKKISLFNALLFGGISVLITNLFFAFVASSDANLSLLSINCWFGQFCSWPGWNYQYCIFNKFGFKKFTAVQYALLTSFMMLPGKFFSGFSGVLADYFISLSSLQTGWTYFFYSTTAMSIPALLIIILYKKTYADHSV